MTITCSQLQFAKSIFAEAMDLSIYLPPHTSIHLRDKLIWEVVCTLEHSILLMVSTCIGEGLLFSVADLFFTNIYQLFDDCSLYIITGLLLVLVSLMDHAIDLRLVFS